MRSRVLEPLGLDATGFDEPPGAARGHVQEGESGHRAVPVDAYPAPRRPSGGLWSSVADLLRFGEHHLAEPSTLHEPRAEALGARYALGFWVRDLGGRTERTISGELKVTNLPFLLKPLGGIAERIIYSNAENLLNEEAKVFGEFLKTRT